MAIFGFRNKLNKLNVNCNLFYYFNGEDNTGSPRKQGKSDLLCDEFMRGALEAGHTVKNPCEREESSILYGMLCLP